MTAPRQPRHRLAEDDPDVPAPSAPADSAAPPDTAAPDEPVDPPTQVLPIIPSQRAAVPQVFPTSPPVVDEQARIAHSGSWGSSNAQPSRRARRGAVPVVLAGVTALVLALGVAVVVVESSAPADAAPISGR